MPTPSTFHCAQCGEECNALPEGVCPDCCEENQAELDAHNAQFDWWEGLDNSERADEIAKAIRRSWCPPQSKS